MRWRWRNDAPLIMFGLLAMALFGALVFIAVGQNAQVERQRARCERAGGIYLPVKDNPDICLRGQTIDIGATR